MQLSVSYDRDGSDIRMVRSAVDPEHRLLVALACNSGLDASYARWQCQVALRGELLDTETGRHKTGRDENRDREALGSEWEHARNTLTRRLLQSLQAFDFPGIPTMVWTLIRNVLPHRVMTMAMLKAMGRDVRDLM